MNDFTAEHNGNVLLPEPLRQLHIQTKCWPIVGYAHDLTCAF